ncbi:bifunctional 2-polyprenyl-6-hydroxyphenol methylase/3-demethylubiquinol 3-O-methyltransferase UbiG [Parasphingopyxis sp.]|uniref:class I SAM-dependent methyltransferase n=1 Tax=Parasphingopyxis sp. TaxID=1920299 RepID=UPI00260CA817|nr:class I SAM-dependent methyltransferase [Parasphingopyxis sp.]
MSETPRDTYDLETLAFYEKEAPVYAASGDQGASRHLPDFLAALSPGAHILELGCGGGRDSAAMIAAGFDVEATDGCVALAAKAEARIGRPVRVMRFAELDVIEGYDGVFANACLLHVPRAGLADILGRIHRALRRGGVFVASYKGGGEEGRDRFGRYFNFPHADWLEGTTARLPNGPISPSPADRAGVMTGSNANGM